jgi:hypothetical protein
VGTDGERLYRNSEPHRRKFKNIQLDPRVTPAIRDEGNSYPYAEIRGRVVETEGGQKAREQIDELSLKYDGHPYPPDDIKTERITVRIVPERQTIAG